MSQRIARRARPEAEWPDYVADPENDRERELRRAYRCTAFWRIAWLVTAALLFLLVMFYGPEVLR